MQSKRDDLFPPESVTMRGAARVPPNC